MARGGTQGQYSVNAQRNLHNKGYMGLKCLFNASSGKTEQASALNLQMRGEFWRASRLTD
jgi:hypothetical protein